MWYSMNKLMIVIKKILGKVEKMIKSCMKVKTMLVINDLLSKKSRVKPQTLVKISHLSPLKKTAEIY